MIIFSHHGEEIDHQTQSKTTEQESPVLYPQDHDPAVAEVPYMSGPWYVTPGCYPEITPAQYHQAPIIGGSVTSSVLRMITPPEYTPADCRYYLDAEREDKNYFDFGSAFHVRVLGRGGEIVEVEAESWRGAAAAEQKAARAAGKIPILTKDLKVVDAMAASTLAHPDCARLLAAFTAELVIVWEDATTGLLCRAMIDFVPDYDLHMILGDLKSKAGRASPSSVSKAMADYRYDQQFAHYLAGCRVRGLGETITPVLVATGKEPPHVPLCRPVDEETIEIGMVCNAKALDLYATSLATDRWPGYDDPDGRREPLSLPGWKRHQFREARDGGLYDIPTEEIF